MKNYTKTIIIYLVFLLLSMAVMFPVIRDMSGTMYGLLGDPDFRIWETWHFKEAFLHGEPFYFTDLIGAPFGVDLTFMPYHLFWDKLLFVTALISNEVFAYNLFMFLSFFLSGITAYHLALYITKNKGISLFSAILYMFCPYHLAHSTGHLTLASIQWLPLPFLFILKFSEMPRFKNSLLVGLSLALVFVSNYYYGVFSYLMLFIFIALIIVIMKIKVTKNFILYSGVSLLISFIVISIFVLPMYKNTMALAAKVPQVSDAYLHSMKYLFSGSAKPLSYLLPSYMHPIFGGFTELFVGSPLYGESRGENSLYLGILPLILSWIAIKRKTRVSRVFLYLFIISVILSMPPYIKLFRLILPLPQFFIFKILPMFRTFARFGIYAMLCVSILAGLGLKKIMEEAGNRTKRSCIYMLSIMIIFLEFFVNPLKYKTDLNNPPEVYKWLAKQKGNFVICEYPLTKDFTMHTGWLIWQRIHKKRKIDGAFTGSKAGKIRKYILRLQDRDTPRILAWLGVKYAIVHKNDMLKSESLDVIGILPDFDRQKGLELIGEFKDIEVYEVTAKPLEINLEKER